MNDPLIHGTGFWSGVLFIAGVIILIAVLVLVCYRVLKIKFRQKTKARLPASSCQTTLSPI